MKKTLFSPGIIISAIIVVLYYVLAAAVYPMMPEKIASHWGVDGNVNGYMDKFWGVMLLPVIATALFLLFLFLPKMDPKRENIEKFRKYYDGFIVLMLLFLGYIYALTIFWNLGYAFQMNIAIIPPFAVLFYYLGELLNHAEMNWTIGIRTPWTLESPAVWKKTQKLGALLFKICGVISLIGILLPEHAFWFIIVPILAVSVFIVLYSYVIFLKQKPRK